MDTKQERQLSAAAARLGPEARAYVEYLSAEFWHRTRAAALGQGFNPAEAEQIARTTTAGVVKAFAGATQHANFLRAVASRRS
ncbi:MAG: hypothetical protein WBC33_05915 [Conexibacter sp.]